MREYAIARSFDMLIDPIRVWNMQEGTIFHKALQMTSPPGWLAEVEMPAYYLTSVCDDKWFESIANVSDKTINVNGKNFRSHSGVWEFEMFPGLWFSWQIDQLRGDYRKIIDYKTKNCPVGHYDANSKVVYSSKCKSKTVNHEIQLQQNLYAYGIKLLYDLPELPDIDIWQLYKGIQDNDMAWLKMPVTKMSPEVLEREVRPNYELFLKAMAKVVEMGDPKPIGEMPLQGLTMYGGKKCFSYCGVKAICDGLGVPTMRAEDL